MKCIFYRIPLAPSSASVAKSSLKRSVRFMLSTILIAVVGLSSNPCQAQSVTSFGTNVEPTLYYNQDDMFTDLFLHCTGWWQNDGSTFTTGADGMITSGHATALIETGGFPSGTYQFYGEGAFKIDFRGTSNDTWPNNGTIPGSQQTVNNVTTALVGLTVPDAAFPTTASYSPQGEILVDVTPTDPNNPPRNFHLIQPGYPAYPNNPMFSNQFLKAVAPFTCMRMMDYMNTNISYGAAATPVTWASRPQDGVFGFNNQGQSYEKMIALANAACKDLWINIPVYATDDWAAGMAQLIKSNLNPNLHVYYEFCNEDWNWGFGQWQVIENWAVANPDLNEAKDGAWYCHGEETAVLLMHFVDIMQPILGSQGRPILAGQSSYTLYTTAGLEWIKKTLGPPSQYIYGIAGAPYFGGDGTETDLGMLFTNIMNGFGTSGGCYQQMQLTAALANQYNVKYCCYESGQGLGASDIFLAAQQDTRMGTCYQTYANVCNSLGVDTNCFFNFVNDWGQYGYWGAVTDIKEIGSLPTIKYTAQAQIALSGRPGCNCSTSSSSSSHNNFSALPTATPMMTKAQMQAWAAQLAAKNKAKAAAAAAAAAAKHNTAPPSSSSSSSVMTKSQMQTWASELAAKNAAKAAASKKKTP